MRDILLIFLRALLLLLATIIALEGALQAAYTHLPQAIIEPMPQYLERIGHRLETEHGGRELPSGEAVAYEVTALSGDLYHISCLSPVDAQPMEPYHVSFKRDNHGFRNEEPWPAGLDLVVIGDSFTAAELIQRPFWQGLSDSMLVLAAPGTGTLEQQRYFEAFAAPRNPELALLAFFAGNDLGDTGEFAKLLRKGQSRRDRHHQDKSLLDYSVALRLLQFLIEATTPVAETSCHYPLIAHTNPPTPVAFYRDFFSFLSADKQALRESEMFQLTRTSIREMSTALRANDGELILMYIPPKAELYWEYLDETAKEEIVSVESRLFHTTNLDELDANMSAQRDLMRDLADEIGVAFLDLTPPLAEAIRAGASPYFFADTHWNQTGHNIARNALLDFLNQSNLES